MLGALSGADLGETLGAFGCPERPRDHELRSPVAVRPTLDRSKKEQRGRWRKGGPQPSGLAGSERRCRALL